MDYYRSLMRLVGGALAILGYLLMVRIGNSIRRSALAEAMYDSGFTGLALVALAWIMMIGGVSLVIWG
jgi:hypothetical protein